MSGQAERHAQYGRGLVPYEEYIADLDLWNGLSMTVDDYWLREIETCRCDDGICHCP